MNENPPNRIDSVDRSSPPQAVAKHAGEFVHDVVTLAELQAVLFKDDVSRGMFRLLRITAVFAVALVIVVSCVPVALMALAYMLYGYGWSLAASFALSAGVGVLAAATCGLAGWIMMSRAKPVFTRSKRELQQNLNWLKQVLARSRSAASAR